MSVFTSPRYPELVICDLGVKFEAGRLESDDPAVVERLRSLDAEFEVSESDDPAVVEAAAKPARARK